MAKTYGGVRNYKTGSSAYRKRRAEYNSLMATGDYKPESSHFYKGGGFVVTHKEHNLAQRDKNGKLVDKSDEAAVKLARKGYRVYLESERSNKAEFKTRDGKVEKLEVDIKTVSNLGKYTIKSVMEKAAKQNANGVVIMQGTKKMTREYVERQIRLFQMKSPKRARDKIKYVIVVGKSGNVHRHKLK